MKLIAFAASNSSTSVNAKLARHAAERFQAEFAPDAEIDILDINDYEMPLYSSDREAADGVPQLAQDFRDRLATADALVISYAEHNGHYPAAYKNLFDWASRLGKEVYQNKPALYLATSPGPGGAGSVLAAAKASAGFFGADVLGALSVPNFFEAFDAEQGALSDETARDELGKLLGALSERLAQAKAA
ncbi:NAD(P)H-dependent oxidoreductase [Rhodobacteraceae bacterium D3-12]|nr:NAD(P)H-dependent oxidoreductase [Rhodobacteraceae bacterium D3-12]